MTTTFRAKRRPEEQYLITGKRRRKLREAIIGYLFILPATVATFVFGVWPVIAGFYESLKSGSPLTNKYVGLDNYIRSLGSLSYILLFGVCLIFLYLGYLSWRSAFAHYQDYGGNLWLFIGPGLFFGAGIISFLFLMVTRADGYSWFPVTMFVLAACGFYAADQFQHPPEERNYQDLAVVCLLLVGIGLVWGIGPEVISTIGLGIFGWILLLILLGGLLYLVLPRLMRLGSGKYIAATITMGTMILAAILLANYTLKQMEKNVQEAQDIAALLFNQQMLNASVPITDEDAQIHGLTASDEIMVDVTVGDETITAPLAPDAFTEVSVDRIEAVQIAISNNQTVPVIVDGEVVEGTITGLSMGQTQSITLQADDPEVTREEDIYSALEVGEDVIRAEGHTEPLRKQVQAAGAAFLSLLSIYLITSVRRELDAESHPRFYRWLHVGRIALGVAAAVLIFYLIGAIELNQQAASGIAALDEDQFKRAYEYATGTRPRASLYAADVKAQLLYWPQLLMIATGALLIGTAYVVWQGAQRRETKRGFLGTLLLAVALMVGGWLLFGELPRTLGLAGREATLTKDALTRTAMYSIGTVPVQLVLGLLLAYLLFSEVKWGKSLYRVIYFMPYIAPSVATSTVFLVIFRPTDSSLANQALSVFGVDPLLWLKEPNGIVRIFYEEVLGGNPLNIPKQLQGPSLALFTVILYNIWVFGGYNAVIFLSGLGAIPGELYEAAEVDGAGRWARFRSITLPLLSPTTFFLSMLSIIGTFKAFAHIYVLRGQATGQEIDTMSIYIFNTLYSANDPGYAAALAFVLFGVILILTMIQNRLAREQVFYG